MRRANTTNWRLDRRINLSVLLQLLVLVSMILASWANLQRQLDLLQRDVTMLLESQKEFQQKLEFLWERGLAHEYRLQILEEKAKQTVSPDKSGPGDNHPIPERQEVTPEFRRRT